MKRYLARHVHLNDTDYGLSVIEISDDHRFLSIAPFIQETHSTSQIDGTLYISFIDNKYKIYSDYLGKYL